MLSPTMTVIVLVVLWLVVVVPMLLRRSDERRRERSVAGFGQAMRALGRRSAVESSREVFVPRRDPAPSPTSAALPRRRPVPAAQEALMYPADRSEMSEARREMMARRRRSLGTLIAGTLLFAVLGFVLGGMMWLPLVPFALGLAGYLYFLRSQALRDRERRQNRAERSAERHLRSYDATTDAESFAPPPGSEVRIDDDDIELQNLDTIDLTGLYVEDDETEPVAERRAS